jgi:hypothetical protein
LAGVVDPHDPLGPGEILDGLAEVGELPVEERARLLVDQQVLRAEVAVDDHAPDASEPGNSRGLDRPESNVESSEPSQHLSGVARLDEVLAVGTARLPEQQGGARRIESQHLRQR